MKQIFFIINPRAKNGQCLKIWEKVEAQLKSDLLPFTMFFTEYPGHAKKLARQISTQNDEHKLIVAVGGDGTVHEVVNGMVFQPHVTLGFIPGGSGNDFSRGFQLPDDPLEAVQIILNYRKKDAPVMDVGKITIHDETKFFINNMGAGFDAAISKEVNRSRMKALFNKLSMGRLIYVYFLLNKLFTYKTSTIRLSIDGAMHIFENTWFVTVSNQPFYGGGMKIAPAALTDDGLLDITVVHNLSKLKLLLVFISVFWGKHIYFKEVETFIGKEISIDSDTKLEVHADGEYIGITPLEIMTHERELPVLTITPRMEEADLKERDPE